MWRKFLEEVEQTENAVVFGLGDYLDWTRTTHRIPLKATWGEDDKAMAQLDELVMDGLVYPFVDTIRKYAPNALKRGAFVTFVEGNHHGVFLATHTLKSGRTTTEEICRLLGIRYAGLSSWVRMTIYRSVGKQKMATGHNLNIVLNHSTSRSGKLAFSLASAQRQLEGWRDVDVFLTANDHQLGHVLRQEIGCTSRGMARPIEYQQVIGKVGSFQKGYQVGPQSNNYVEKRFLHPSQLGWLSFDAHLYFRELINAEKRSLGLHMGPESWRYANFNV